MTDSQRVLQPDSKQKQSEAIDQLKMAVAAAESSLLQRADMVSERPRGGKCSIQ